MVLACDVVWHEVYDESESCLMCASDEVPEFLHALCYVCGEVWVDIVVVLDGVWTSSSSFHDLGVVFAYAPVCVVGLCGVLDESCVPDVCDSQFAYLLQSLVCEVSHGAASIFVFGAVRYALWVVVSEESGEYLIDGHVIRCP